eukprot:3937384-Pleurochrysis_carterae.AAC.1
MGLLKNSTTRHGFGKRAPAAVLYAWLRKLGLPVAELQQGKEQSKAPNNLKQRLGAALAVYKAEEH